MITVTKQEPLPERAKRIAAELDDQNANLDRKARGVIRELLDTLEALQAEVARLRRDADELNFLNADLLYWTERAVSKGNANSDIEEAYERYEQWLKARAAITKETP